MDQRRRNPIRLLKSRLPNGEMVQIDTGSQSRFQNLANARQHFVKAIYSSDSTESELLHFLSILAPVVFPMSDPSAPPRLMHSTYEGGVDLLYRCSGSERFGIVQIKHPKHSLRADIIQSQLEQVIRLNQFEVFHAHVVAGRGQLTSLQTRLRSTAWPFQVEFLSWNDVVDRVAVPEKDEEFSATIMLVEIVDYCRTLLARIARHPEVLNMIDDRKFEELVATLMSDLGFEDVELTPARQDGGKDVIATRVNSANGQREVYFIECKHWIAGQKVYVSLATKLHSVVKKGKVAGGILLSSSGFGPTLLEQQLQFRRKKIHLRDRSDLAQWIELWERRYGGLLIEPIDPLKVLGLKK